MREVLLLQVPPAFSIIPREAQATSSSAVPVLALCAHTFAPLRSHLHTNPHGKSVFSMLRGKARPGEGEEGEESPAR